MIFLFLLILELRTAMLLKIFFHAVLFLAVWSRLDCVVRSRMGVHVLVLEVPRSSHLTEHFPSRCGRLALTLVASQCQQPLLLSGAFSFGTFRLCSLGTGIWVPPAVAQCLSEGKREAWATHPGPSFSKTSCTFEVGTTRVCFKFYLRIFSPEVSWKILWFATFLLTDEAKDLGCRVAFEAKWGGVSPPPVLTLQSHAPQNLSGEFVVRILVAN